VQCTRCQLYGHTKSCCNRPCVCVKCGGQHSTDSRKKSKTTPATCSLCGGDHPTNYKGCDYYQKHYHAKHANNRPPAAQRYAPPFTPQQPQTSGSNLCIDTTQRRTNASYPQRGRAHVPNSISGEFKVMFNQLTQQNSMFLNPLNIELYPICNLLVSLGAHHILHVSRIRVNMLTMLLNNLNIG